MFTHTVYQIVFGAEFDAQGDTIARQDQMEALRHIQTLIADTYGGYTLYDSEGSWFDPKTDILVEELGYTLSIAIDGLQGGSLHITDDLLAQFARRIGRLMWQKSVMLVRGDLAMFVDCS